MRKKVKTGAFVLFVLLAFIMAGCAGKPVVEQYKMLDSAADLRLLILESAGRYYKAGIIDEYTKTKILEIDQLVQQTGMTATAKLKEVDRLNTLNELDPGSVPADEYLAAQRAYEAAKAAFRKQWAELNKVIAPWLLKWLEEALEGGN